MSNLIEKQMELQEPFEPDDIVWRVQSCGVNNGKAWVIAIPYITNRAIQHRLDEVFGWSNWRNEFKPVQDGYLCGISVKVGTEWITKWDGAETTDIEKLKGGLSGSMKRAAVQFGIGRYLYNLESYFAVCSLVDYRSQCEHNHAAKKIDGTVYHIDWQDPELPEWALPSMMAHEYIDRMKACENLMELKQVFKESYLYAKSFNRADLRDQFQTKYEERKSELDIEAQKNVELAYQEINAWLSKQIKTLKLIPEQSSVIRVCETMRDHIKETAEGQYYDTKPLLERVDQAQADRLNKIKTNEEQPND